MTSRQQTGRRGGKNAAAPLVSIVIPVYNEEALLFGSVVELVERMKKVRFPYEILLCENGSTDGTVEIGLELERRFAQVRLLRSPAPNYGRALRLGIETARGEFVICEEIDILDTRFHERSLKALRADQCDMVVGSKLHPESHDHRPFIRHTATQTINLMLRLSLGFRGSDTHGLKAFRRERLLPVVASCIVEKDLFASELVIRAERADYRILELPVEIVEKRPPAINLFRRVPHVLMNLGQLVLAIRFNRAPREHR